MFKKLFNILPDDLKISFYYLLLILFLLNLFQIVSISSIIPLLSILLDENLIFDNKYLYFIYEKYNFENVKDFKIVISIICSILVSLSSFLVLLSNYNN